MRMSHPDPNGPSDRTPIRVGEVWENPVTWERATILERPWDNPAGRGMAQALSGVSVGSAFVDRVYAKLTPIYDVVFGAALQAGRVAAMERMPIRSGDRVLEVGIGTGLTAALYPPHCSVTGIDLSAGMLEKASARLRRARLRNVRLIEMDAANMRFEDGSFDFVYAPYTISVVPDPVRVAQEMCRVCKPGGSIVFLNHFRSTNPVLSLIERIISPMTVHVGFKADLDLPAFLERAELSPVSIEKVNVPQIWTLVTCIREPRQTDADLN